MISFSISDPDAESAVREVMRELPEVPGESCVYHCEPGGEGISIRRMGQSGEIRYADRRALLRAVSIAAEFGTERCFERRETPAYRLLCAMPDVSRNAVPKLESLKRLCRIAAMEGYNALMLYTEDLYELPGYPYFGHLRGRYSSDELRELDGYAALLGLELIPCIQTLAHLNGFFEWPSSRPLQDCNDILLAGEERVYEMIDAMLSAMKSTLKSDKIHIGLDEAFLLGSGQYLDRFGYRERSGIMLEHLSRVSQLCRKHGYQPRMWSDMFFRMQNRGAYRVPGTVIPAELAASVPEEMVLVYWDYLNPDENGYDEMFRQHRAFRNPIAFAGGDASWYGPVPLNQLAARCADAAAASLARNGIREVYVTMWKDDGGACSLFSSMSTLFRYGEACWNPGGSGDGRSARRLRTCTGLTEEALFLLEQLNNNPGRRRFGQAPCNPSRYIFYENILTGKFHCHIPDGTEAHYRGLTPVLERCAGDGGAYAYLFRTLAAFCRVLERKAELGKRLYRAYGRGDRQEVRKIRDGIPELSERVRSFRGCLREQWFRENKTFGFDVLDIRIGGLLAQLDTAQVILDDWLSGRRSAVAELECPRLPYGTQADKGYDNGVLLVSRWERMAAQNVSNMFGI